MKTLLQIISIAIVLFIVYLLFTNSTTIININAFTNCTINFPLYTIIILFAGIFVGSILIGQLYFEQKNKLGEYKRKMEKDSVVGMENSSKIDVLEAKIKTLEKALDNALNK